jgi:hypothetical protein
MWNETGQQRLFQNHSLFNQIVVYVQFDGICSSTFTVLQKITNRMVTNEEIRKKQNEMFISVLNDVASVLREE